MLQSGSRYRRNFAGILPAVALTALVVPQLTLQSTLAAGSPKARLQAIQAQSSQAQSTHVQSNKAQPTKAKSIRVQAAKTPTPRSGAARTPVGNILAIPTPAPGVKSSLPQPASSPSDNNVKNVLGDVDSEVGQRIAEQHRQQLQRQIALFAKQQKNTHPSSAVMLEAISDFYRARDYAPLWIAASRVTGVQPSLNESGAALLKTFEQAGAIGLPFDALAVASDPASRELELSWQLLTLGLTMTANLDEISHPRPATLSRLSALSAELLLEIGAFGDPALLFRAWEPRHPDFRGLKQALSDYQKYAEQGAWPSVAGSKVLRPGSSNKVVPSIRARLLREGYALDKNPANPLHIDTQLAGQIMEFQGRHGLRADGVVGRSTYAALNITLDQRIAQLKRSMLRLLALPSNLGDDYVWVNIPAFRMAVMSDNSEALSMGVIVGKTKHQTPEFADVMETMEINPYWNVPTSITREEILPDLLASKGYLRRHQMDVLERNSSRVLDANAIDWQAAATSGVVPFRLRQRPGAKNPLGRVKFLFPNKHAVYMHDTPHPRLFAKSRRAFSHGCVRLSEPMKLAEYVLANHFNGRVNLRRALRSSKNLSVKLDKPLPVYLSYSTAWLGESGFVHFSEDIYKRDHRATPLVARVFSQLEQHWQTMQIVLNSDQCSDCVATAAH